jgi:hypothetical protein
MEGIDRLDSAAARELRAEYEVLTSALIAKDVYFDRSISELLPEGVVRITNDSELDRELNLSNAMLVNEDSGYYAAAYRVGSRFIIANRGTEFSSGVDWYANFIQGTGRIGAQYEQALRVAEAANAEVGDRVSFVGHSLGGGLASAQALAFRRQATTFNSSGVHARTVERYGISPSAGGKYIKAYYVEGEVLSYLQDSGKHYASAVARSAEAQSADLWVAATLTTGKSISQLLAEMPAASGQRIGLTARREPRMAGSTSGWAPGSAVPAMQVPVHSIGLHGMANVVFALYADASWTQQQPAPPVQVAPMPGQYWPSPTRVSPGQYRY